MKSDLKRNGSGCLDPTAYQAIMNADAVSSVDKANRYKRRENDSEERLNKLLAAIFAICDAADFHIEERIVVKDKRTGKVFTFRTGYGRTYRKTVCRLLRLYAR